MIDSETYSSGRDGTSKSWSWGNFLHFFCTLPWLPLLNFLFYCSCSDWTLSLGQIVMHFIGLWMIGNPWSSLHDHHHSSRQITKASSTRNRSWYDDMEFNYIFWASFVVIQFLSSFPFISSVLCHSLQDLIKLIPFFFSMLVEFKSEAKCIPIFVHKLSF